MKNFVRVFLAMLFVSALLFNSLPSVSACGPSFIEPVFSFNSRPTETDFAEYAKGNLGIVKPEFARSFLFTAYRQFSGRPFSAKEQKDLQSVWRSEFFREDDNETNTNAVVKEWVEARRKVVGATGEPTIYTARQYDGGYDFFPNCTANAFETATKTLNDRLAKYGATDASVKNWIEAQDVVFSNCSEGKNIPAEVPANAPGWLKNDREYQTAAAHFYATNFADAKVRFEKIAQNSESAWQPTANYLVARTLIREGSLAYDGYTDGAEGEAAKQKQRELFGQAEAQLNKVVADASNKEFHDAARKLLNLTKYRLRPKERAQELAEELTGGDENPNLRLDLIDYKWLLDKINSEADTVAVARAEKAAKDAGKEYDYIYRIGFKDQPATARANDLTDWIFTYEANDNAAFRHSLAKWNELKSTAWFVAAIASADKSNVAEIPALLAEAEKTAPNSSAFQTIAYHQIRLLIETGKTAEAKNKLNSILLNKSIPLPVATFNQFSAQRFKLAENIDDFLTFAQRRPATFAYDGSASQSSVNFDEKDDKGNFIYTEEREWMNRTMFDTDGARLFNEAIPLEVLKQIAVNPKLPKHLQRNVLIAVWTRAVVFGNDAMAREIAPVLVKVAPEFQANFATYLNAKTAAERKNSAIYVLLKTPALRTEVESGFGRRGNVSEIDSYRDNWWCAPTGVYYDNNGNKIELEALSAPAFLTNNQFVTAQNQREQLKTLGNAPNWLAQEAVAFANRAPKDVRVPETLHIAVAKATRYGCVDESVGKFSKAAHDLLRKNYRTSEWAKKTPYWYKGN